MRARVSNQLQAQLLAACDSKIASAQAKQQGWLSLHMHAMQSEHAETRLA